MILYPTETIYALGVNALDEKAVNELFQFKGRAEGKSVSWLVRDIEDIAHYGELTPSAARIAAAFLPGPLTLVLRARDCVSRPLLGPNDSVSFRISPDPTAAKLIADYMSEHTAPLTCTSANVSGQPPQETVAAILKQFSSQASMIDRVIDDGPRTGAASTVVRALPGAAPEILRVGAISRSAILSVD